MPLKTEIDLNSQHGEELLEIVAVNHTWNPAEMYEFEYEEASKICDPDDFDLGYDGIHWCLQYTKEAFVEASNKLKAEYYGEGVDVNIAAAAAPEAKAAAPKADNLEDDAA